jgi:hypothetical protein
LIVVKLAVLAEVVLVAAGVLFFEQAAASKPNASVVAAILINVFFMHPSRSVAPLRDPPIVDYIAVRINAPAGQARIQRLPTA